MYKEIKKRDPWQRTPDEPVRAPKGNRMPYLRAHDVRSSNGVERALSQPGQGAALTLKPSSCAQRVVDESFRAGDHHIQMVEVSGCSAARSSSSQLRRSSAHG